MRRPLMLLLAVPCVLLVSAAAQQRHETRSYLNSPAAPRGWQSAAFWCDAGHRVLALTQPLKRVARAQPVQLLRWTGAQFTRQRYQLGLSDAGAGSVVNTIAPAGQQPDSGGLFKYYVHTSNVENTRDPAYQMDRVVEFVMPEGTYACRYNSQATFMGATARHSITVLKNGTSLRYISVDRDGSAGLSIVAGTHKVNAAGDEYRWTNAGYTYLLHVRSSGTHLDVLCGQQTVQRETFLAYSVSVNH